MNAALQLNTEELSVRLVGREAFAQLREPWTRLARSMAEPTPFGSWEWAAAWLETIGAAAQARFILLHSGDELRGILPLVASGGRGLPPRPRSLTLCAVERVYPDQLSPLAAAADLPILLDRAFAQVWEDRQRWDCVRLPMIAQDSLTFAELAGRSAALRARSKFVTSAPYLTVAGTYEEFLGRLSSNERYKIRNRSKKLLAGQGATYEDLGSMPPADALGVLRDLHSRRAQQKGIHSTFDTDPVQRFHAALLRRLPADQVILRCLRKQSDIFAMFYGFRCATRLFYFQLGYDPNWSEFSPGLVLLSQTIREAFESGCSEYNFLQGDEPFKRTWTRQSRRLHDWEVFRPGLRGALYCELSRIREATKSGILRLRSAAVARARRGSSADGSGN